MVDDQPVINAAPSAARALIDVADTAQHPKAQSSLPVSTIEPGQDLTAHPVYPGGEDTSVLAPGVNTPIHTNEGPLSKGEIGSEAHTSYWEEVHNSYNQASKNLPIGLPMADEQGWLIRHSWETTAKENSSQADLTPEQANKIFPDMPVPFSENVNPAVAKIRYDNAQRWKAQQEWADTGKGTPGWNLAFGVLGGIADPSMLALGIATGGATEAAGVTGAVGVYASNFVLGAAQGISAGKMLERENAATFSYGSAFKEAAESAVGGTILHYAVGAISAGVKAGIRELRDSPADLVEKAARTVQTQAENGVKPNLEHINEEIAARNRGEVKGQPGSGYISQPIKEITDRPYYVGKGLKESGPVLLDDFGKNGVQATDNSQAMNNRINGQGDITEIRLSKDSKILNLEQPATPETIASSFGPEVLAKLPEDMLTGERTLKDVMAELNDNGAEQFKPEGVQTWDQTGKSFLEHAQDLAKQNGYQGYSYEGRDLQGVSVDKRLHLFQDSLGDMHNPALGEPILIKEFNANPETVPRMSVEQEAKVAAEAKDPANSIYAQDQQMNEKIREAHHEKAINSHPEDLDTTVQDIHDQHMEQLKVRAESGSVAAKEALQELQRAKATDQQESDLIKRIADCAAGGVT